MRAARPRSRALLPPSEKGVFYDETDQQNRQPSARRPAGGADALLRCARRDLHAGERRKSEHVRRRGQKPFQGDGRLRQNPVLQWQRQKAEGHRDAWRDQAEKEPRLHGQLQEQHRLRRGRDHDQSQGGLCLYRQQNREIQDRAGPRQGAQDRKDDDLRRQADLARGAGRQGLRYLPL